MQHGDGVGGQVVEQGGDFVEEHRQVVLDPRGGNAGGHVAVHAFARWIAFEDFAKAAPETCAPGFVHRKFARGQQTDLVDLVKRALAVHIESTDRIDSLIEQFDPVGQGAAHGEEVDDPPAHTVLARGNDLGHMRVTGGQQLRLERFGVERLSGFKEERVGREVGRWAEPVERGRSRRDGDIKLAALDLVERGQPLGHQIVVWREIVVGQGLPVRQQEHPLVGRKPADLVDQALRIERGRADHHQRVRFRGIACDGQRVARAGKPAKAPAGWWRCDGKCGWGVSMHAQKRQKRSPGRKRFRLSGGTRHVIIQA